MKFAYVLEQYPDVEPTAEGWYNVPACPACDGKEKFGFKEGDNGWVVYNCYRKCSPVEINAALGEHVAAAFDYEDEHGNVVAQRVRIEYANNIDPVKGKPHKDFLPYLMIDGKRAKKSELKGVKLSWYRRSEVREAAANGGTIWITEGEAKADKLRAALRAAGIDDAVTSPPGGSVTVAMAAELRGASKVIVLGDNDDTGRKKAQTAARLAAAEVTEVRLKEALPGVEVAGDIADWLDDGGLVADLLALVEAAPVVTKSEAPVAKKQADCYVFLDQDNEPCADIIVNGRRQTHRIMSQAFRLYVIHTHFLADGKAPSETKVREEISTLCATAHFSKRVHHVFKRIGEAEGNVYVDLGDRAVEITPDGWNIVEQAPVRFRRPQHSLSLPEPVRGGSFTELRRFLNTSDDDWVLAAGWLLGAMRANGPYNILSFASDSGSGKTSATFVLQGLLDPHVAGARKAPKGEADVSVAAKNAYALVYDNLSSIPTWLSDQLCSLSTGGADSSRLLYTNDEEVIIKLLNPVLLTSISEIGHLPDLFARSYIVKLLAISEDKRLTDEDFKGAFREAQPRLLGALYDTVALGLRRLPQVKAAGGPLVRMGSTERWVNACEPAFGVPEGTFSRVVRENLTKSDEHVVNTNVIGETLRKIIDGGPIDATASDLKMMLDTYPGVDTRDRFWPKSAHALAMKLNTIKPSLRKLGYVVDERTAYEGPGGKKKVKRWHLAPGNAAAIGGEPPDIAC